MKSFLNVGWLGITAKLSPWPRIHGRIARDHNYHWSQWWLFPSMDNNRASRSISNYSASGLRWVGFPWGLHEYKDSIIGIIERWKHSRSFWSSRVCTSKSCYNYQKSRLYSKYFHTGVTRPSTDIGFGLWSMSWVYTVLNFSQHFAYCKHIVLWSILSFTLISYIIFMFGLKHAYIILECISRKS